jgi:hypothetical protein
MPSRIVRDGINSSPRVNRLSMGAEVLYRRLMSVADDYGRYHASAVTIRGACWPTCPEKVTERDVNKWLAECMSGDRPLIQLYESDGSRYLLIDGFGQQVRTKSKFPAPPGGPENNPPSLRPQSDISLKSDQQQNVRTSRSRISESESESKAYAQSNAEPVVRAPVAAMPRKHQPRAADLSGITGNRFHEFWENFPLQDDRDSTARMYISVVTEPEEAAVFACLERYRASDAVSRGVVMSGWKWLEQQKRNGWQGNWPARASPDPGKTRQELQAERWERA